MLGRYLSRAETLGDSLAMLRLTFSVNRGYYSAARSQAGLNLENVLLLLAAAGAARGKHPAGRGFVCGKSWEQNLPVGGDAGRHFRSVDIGMYGSGYDAAGFYEQF